MEDLIRFMTPLPRLRIEHLTSQARVHHDIGPKAGKAFGGLFLFSRAHTSLKSYTTENVTLLQDALHLHDRANLSQSILVQCQRSCLRRGDANCHIQMVFATTPYIATLREREEIRHVVCMSLVA